MSPAPDIHYLIITSCLMHFFCLPLSIFLDGYATMPLIRRCADGMPLRRCCF